jgi:dephospho-CoA kinase
MPSSRDFLLVGITGGIGSGKSLVCSLFERLGRVALRADAIAQEVADSNAAVRRQVTTLLGAAAYPENGPLNRLFVAEKVFSDASLLRSLNAIIHPVVFEEVEARSLAVTPDRRRPYVLVEAALIYESGMDEMLDKVIVVDAEEETRIRRVMDRDGLTREDVLRRIAAQMPAARKVAHADFVIRNQENTVSLEDKVRFIDAILASMCP